MDEHKRRELWDTKFAAEMRHRYFIALKDRLDGRLRGLSIAIAVLSCGPLVGLMWEIGTPALLAVLGVLAGVIGIYLSTSGLARSLAVATQAATLWGQQASRLNRLWTRSESGESVWEEFVKVDEEMSWVDAVATEHLTLDRIMLDRAWNDTAAAV